MIYCDFGVLSIEEREMFLKNILFIFDILNKHAIENMNFQKDWEVSEGGFWQENPYLCLSQSRHFPEKKAILDQTIIIDEENNYKVYRFWNHYFNKEDIKHIFKRPDFIKAVSYQDLLEGDGLYNDKGVTFYKVIK